jgi:integrase
VTEAGGHGIHKLCPVADGEKAAEKALAAYLRDVQEAAAAGMAQADAPYTVAQLAAELVQLKQVTKKDATFDHYQKNLKRLVDWYGDLEARKVRLTQGAEYVSRLKGLGLANTSVNHHLQAAKAVFNYGVEEGHLTKNPWRKLQKLPGGRRKRLMTDEEFRKLVAACDKCSAFQGKVTRAENRALMLDILHTLRFTAMRPGELRILRGDHLRFDGDDCLIIIPAEEQKTGTTAKEPEDRIIPVLPEVKPILLARKDRYGSGRLFPNLFGEAWTGQLLSQRFARLRRRAGLDAPDRNGEVLVLYSLRHTRLSECGVTEKWSYPVLQRMAGHARGSSVTMRYMHPGQDDVLRAAKEGRERRLGSS